MRATRPWRMPSGPGCSGASGRRTNAFATFAAGCGTSFTRHCCQRPGVALRMVLVLVVRCGFTEPALALLITSQPMHPGPALRTVRPVHTTAFAWLYTTRRTARILRKTYRRELENPTRYFAIGRLVFRAAS